MNITRLLVFGTAFLLCHFALTGADRAIAQPSQPRETRFAEVADDFPGEWKNLRKWDAPVVADLDQDGYVDLILNEHGFGVRIAWNNKGTFAEPYDLIMGDLHGISVADFDSDGNLEIILSRGGGSGSNARNAKVFRVSRNRQFTMLGDFRPPLPSMRGRTVKFFDGDNDGRVDLINFAFPSRENAGTSENYVFRNTGQGQFHLAGTLPPVQRDGQKTLLTDIDGDRVIDLVLYGDGRVVAYRGKGGLVFEDVTDAVLPYDLKDVTCIVELDFDNDGDFDLFMTRGREFEAGETFFDQQAGTWGFFTKRGPFDFDDLVVGDILELQNYQAQWPSKHLYLGESAYEFEFPGETHSGRDVRLVNSDALGWPDDIPEDGTCIGYVGNRRWRIAGDIWSPISGIVKGVIKCPDCDHPQGLSDVLLENQDGRFRDVTLEMNLPVEEHTTGAAVADFDNNGYQDIVVIRRGDLVHENVSLVYLNQGKSGFELVRNSSVVSPELGAIGLGVETFDYDRDGRVDIIVGNERGQWHLFNNQSENAGGQNYITVPVGRPSSEPATSLDALVTVKAGDTRQIKRVGACGAAYSRSYDPFVHFGLGSYEGEVEIEVQWTDGHRATATATGANQSVTLGEVDR